MIEKIQFTDFNKFLASIGLILIAIGLLLPFFYLRENFSLDITQESLKKLTPTAVKIIELKQGYAFRSIEFVPFVSVSSIIIGFLALVIGGYMWYKRQRVEDEKLAEEIVKLKKESAKIDAEKEKITGDKMTQNQVIEKNEIEVNELFPNVEPDKRNLLARNYFHIENLFAEKFKHEYGNEYNVFTNYKINHNEYDIILSAPKVEGRLDLKKDCIVEIKFFKQITLKLLKDTLEKVANMIKAYPTKPYGIVIFVLQEGNPEIDGEKIKDDLTAEWGEKTMRKWQLLFFREEDIPLIKLKDNLSI